MKTTTRFIFALGMLSAGACGGNTSGSITTKCSALTSFSAQRPTAWPGTVFTIVMENHSRDDIIGSHDAPYINSLATQNTVAAGYHDNYIHPSNPNYIWMVSGENFGILDDNDPSPTKHIASTSHLADQIESAGLTWKTYQESMGQACGLSSRGRYAAKHNPFIYFDDVNGWDGTALHATPRCLTHVMDYSQLAVDLAANEVPDYVFITPNLDDDMHDGSITEGDAWLEREVPNILASEAFRKGGVLFLTWDEGGGLPATDDPPFIAISPNVQFGLVSNTDYDTSSFLKTTETLLGIAPLPCSETAAAVPIMTDLFSVPMTQ